MESKVAVTAHESKSLARPGVTDYDSADGGFEADFKPLTSGEAAAWRARQKPVSLWLVVWFQAGIGLAVSLAAWAVWGRAHGVSAAWGALSVVFPAMLFARGLTRSALSGNSGAALLRLMVWEAVKVVITLAMLLAAPRVIAQLNWLALVAGFVVTMKMYWLVWWLQARRQTSRV